MISNIKTVKAFYLLSLIISVFFTIISSLLKKLHWPGASFMQTISFFISLIFILIGFYKVYTSNTLTSGTKWFWVICLIILNWVGGLIFYFMELQSE